MKDEQEALVVVLHSCFCKDDLQGVSWIVFDGNIRFRQLIDFIFLLFCKISFDQSKALLVVWVDLTHQFLYELLYGLFGLVDSLNIDFD